MLKSLYIKDYALVDELKVEFNSGLNIITGETGAGKSIIVGALAVILGDRFEKEVIRTGANKTVLEADFVLPETSELLMFFKDNDLIWEKNSVLIRRELHESGRSRSFINDTPVPISVLVTLGDILVDLHGQHQHQLLLQVTRHIDYLDEFAGLWEDVNHFRSNYQQYIELNKKLNELLKHGNELKQKTDLLVFELNEIKSVNPQPDEDEELKKEEKILKNSEILFESTRDLFNNLYENEGSVSEVLKKSLSVLEELAGIDEKFISIKSECENAAITIDEIANSLGDYNNKINFDSDRLEEIRQRMALLTGLKKKYGGSIETILDKKQSLQQELLLIENLDEEIASIKHKVNAQLEYLKETGLDLSQRRRKAADELGSKVKEELSQFGMVNVRFSVSSGYKETTEGHFLEIDGRRVQIFPKGMDQVEFLISANPGENLKPLATVASGGEISRIMLALKTLLAEADKVPVLIFDEIDIGISGRIAQSVGKSLRKLSQSHQIICITHLPQIASSGHQQYLVEKISSDIETKTTIRKLSREERIEQIARLIGGKTITDAHLSSALELMNEVDLIEK
ncbi:DNA repair protein RecN [candidate division KSB1 bacterium]|nr:DNA repair protein RecN [candidate division KSB1 bacterium]